MKTFNTVYYLASASGLRNTFSLGVYTGGAFTGVRNLNCLYSEFLFCGLLSELKQCNAAMSGGENAFHFNGVCLKNF